jgi:signal transduction histidine kinase/ligand-binding sensor domain-containing protein
MLVCLASTLFQLGAAQPAPAFTQLAHTAWTVRDGAPGAVRALAQGADGVLWIATEQGLFQFDGVRFARYEPPPGQVLQPHGIQFLLPLPDTSLWIGHLTSGVSVIHREKVITYEARDRLPSGTVTAIARDSSGTMWASTTRGLARLNGRRWEEVGSEEGYPGGFTEPVLVDARGTVWVGSSAGIYVLPREAKRFERRTVAAPRGGDTSVEIFSMAPDGSIWGVQQPMGLFPIAAPNGSPPPVNAVAYPDTIAFGLTFAPGRPAVVTSKSGRLIRLWLPEMSGSASPRKSLGMAIAAEVPFSRAAGMSGDRIMAAVYDREGTLWIGTPTGIDRFRETKLTPIEWPGQVSWLGVASDTNGAVWVAARNGAPSTLITIGQRVVPHPHSPPTLTSIYRDLRGGILVGGEYGLWERKGDLLAPVPLPSPASRADRLTMPIQAIARDRDGRLWVSISTDGVYRQRVGGGWARFGESQGLGKAVANAITTDSGGRTWLGYPNGQVVLVVGDSVRMLLAADRLDVGNVLAISAYGDDRVWIAGQSGVAALSRGAVIALSTSGEPLRGVSGVVEDADGQVWLNSADGVIRIDANDVRRALAEPGYRVPYERLDYRDGIEPPAPQIRPLPSAVVGTDGRIWFTSAGGVSWVDPRRVRRNSVRPPVRLRALTVGGRRYPGVLTAGDTIQLPARTTALSVAYTAYSLAVPERVRFKYRLDGLDTAWQDVGGRREAIYTNLRPGRYGFRVIAANDDGVWNDMGAALSFRILPAWYETGWFRGFVVLLIGGLGAAAAAFVQRIRHGRLRAALKAEYEATLAERARIAQDLHDTLLQGFAGVTLQLKTAELALPEEPDVAAETILRVQRLARESLREARERVWDLRDADIQVDDLPAALERVARERAAGTRIEVSMETAGARRRLTRAVEDAAFRIGREALVNAVRHADAHRIDIRVEFGPDRLRLEVRDDGRGFTPQDAEEAHRNGHFGLKGVRERASRMGGVCDVRARPGGGTVVALELPLFDGIDRA